VKEIVLKFSRYKIKFFEIFSIFNNKTIFFSFELKNFSQDFFTKLLKKNCTLCNAVGDHVNETVGAGSPCPVRAVDQHGGRAATVRLVHLSTIKSIKMI
jgi:hypothetical protein